MPKKLMGNDRDWSNIRGFNYRPSYGTTGLEIWSNFNERAIETEIALGKHYFPHINAIRWWQSWDAFQRDAKGYAQNFETSLQLTDPERVSLLVVVHVISVDVQKAAQRLQVLHTNAKWLRRQLRSTSHSEN